MRADMDKVLVERPRLGRRRAQRWPGKGYRKRVRKALDAGDAPPPREGMRATYGHGTKSFNEHLGPLRRFLNSNVGRPWDAVYSEICAVVDRDNVVQKHILTHLFDYVTVRTVLIDGEPCRAERNWGGKYGESVRTSARRDRWYVCPKSGLLRKSRFVPYKSKRGAPPLVVRLNNRTACARWGDRWELLSVERTSRASGDQPMYECLLQELLAAPGEAATRTVERRGDRYLLKRQPLTRKELLALPIPIDLLK